WSSDVCSSDLGGGQADVARADGRTLRRDRTAIVRAVAQGAGVTGQVLQGSRVRTEGSGQRLPAAGARALFALGRAPLGRAATALFAGAAGNPGADRLSPADYPR